jgi:glycerol-3-phosphate dehydrogenase
VDRAASLAGLPRRPCRTRDLPVHGHAPDAARFGDLAGYGSDAVAIRALIAADAAQGERLHPALPYVAAEVVLAVRAEMARTVDDVLARRLRALFLNAGAAIGMAPRVAALMAHELGRDAAWEADQTRTFVALAAGYRVSEASASP